MEERRLCDLVRIPCFCWYSVPVCILRRRSGATLSQSVLAAVLRWLAHSLASNQNDPLPNFNELPTCSDRSLASPGVATENQRASGRIFRCGLALKLRVVTAVFELIRHEGGCSGPAITEEHLDSSVGPARSPRGFRNFDFLPPETEDALVDNNLQLSPLIHRSLTHCVGHVYAHSVTNVDLDEE